MGTNVSLSLAFLLALMLLFALIVGLHSIGVYPSIRLSVAL